MLRRRVGLGAIVCSATALLLAFPAVAARSQLRRPLPAVTATAPIARAARRPEPASVVFPNNPGFAGCEHEDPLTGCTDSEQWDLFGPLPGDDCPTPGTEAPVLPHPDGGLPCWAPQATDPQHAAGVDMTGAQLDLVYGDADGYVNALRPSGREVPGFPVYTDYDRQIDPSNPENLRARAYRDVPALRNVRDPVVGIAVGDLFGDGSLDIVATSSNGDVYVWNSHGHRLHGFPVFSARRYWSLPVPTPSAPTAHGRLPSRGDLAPPVLAALGGGHRLDILMSAYDGHVYAWQPDGRPVPGWPVEIKLPAADFARDGVDPSQYIRDSKLIYAVAVGDVLGTGRPQVFVSSFECNGKNTPTSDLEEAFAGIKPLGTDDAGVWLYGLWGDGNRHPGGAYLPHWPVFLPTGDFCYDQSIDFVGEGTSPPLIGNFGAGHPQIVTSPVTGPVYVINPDGTIARSLSPACQSAACAPDPPYRPTGDTDTITLTGQGALGDLYDNGTPQFVQSSVGVESIARALDDSGQAALPQFYEKAWNVSTGAVEPNFPVRQDGLPFFDAPLVADVGNDGTRQVIEGNDSYWIHAFDVNGGEAPGFPKYTGQWPSFSGVIGDATMNGQLRFAVGTREGWLFVWRVDGSARLDNSWSHLRGNDYNSGLYGQDTARPEAILDLRRGGRTVSWRAPGGDYELGQAAAYRVLACSDRSCSHARRLFGAPTPVPAGAHQHMRLPALPRGTRYLAVRAINAAGNLSALSDVVAAR